MKAVIVAAGTGSRMHGQTPKTLLPFHDETILSTIVRNLSLAGITEIIIVVGCQADHVREYITKNKARFDVAISLVENHQFTRGNGISVLVSESAVGNADFILSMSDHVVTSSAIQRVADSKSPANLLLVDPRVASVFDIDDATKVNVSGARIVDIGKEITGYNAIDCGIFRLTSRFYDSMRAQLLNGRESISDAIKVLIKNNDMEAVYMQDSEQWFDIDTPDAYAHALSQTAPTPQA
jgi:1L-myo-inositol 1-phosphate cytidylyltransferase